MRGLTEKERFELATLSDPSEDVAYDLDSLFACGRAETYEHDSDGSFRAQADGTRAHRSSSLAAEPGLAPFPKSANARRLRGASGGRSVCGGDATTTPRRALALKGHLELLREYPNGSTLKDKAEMATRMGALLSADAMQGARTVGKFLIAAPLHPVATITLPSPVFANFVEFARE